MIINYLRELPLHSRLRKLCIRSHIAVRCRYLTNGRDSPASSEQTGPGEVRPARRCVGRVNFVTTGNCRRSKTLGQKAVGQFNPVTGRRHCVTNTAVRSHCSPPVIRAPLQQADRSSSRYSRPPCLPHRDFGAAEGLPLTAASSGRMTGAAAVSLRSRCLTPEPVSLRRCCLTPELLSQSGAAVSVRSCCQRTGTGTQPTGVERRHRRTRHARRKLRL